jgi:MFS family permease
MEARALGPGRSLAGKLGLLATLYFSQGLPFGFFTQALPALLRRQGHGLREVGLSSLVALPWALKFLWAPLVDRLSLPRLGRRRSWILPAQALTALLLLALALSPPDGSLALVIAGAFLSNLFTATQDIASDALAIDILAPEERGIGNGVRVGGYRAGMIAGGGATLVLLERAGWAASLAGMALLVALATVPLLRERESAPETPSTGSVPRESFLARRDGARILLLLVVYKAGDAFAVGMLRPFLVDRGLGLADVGALVGTVGFLAGLVGALAGGALVPRLGRRRSLVLFGLGQALTVAGYAAVARSPSPAMLGVACAAEHFAGGTATAALFTCMMDWSRPRSCASDYTIQASAVVIATGLASAASGFSAQALGYPGHFAAAAALAALAVGAASLLFPEETSSSKEGAP